MSNHTIPAVKCDTDMCHYVLNGNMDESMESFSQRLVEDKRWTIEQGVATCSIHNGNATIFQGRVVILEENPKPYPYTLYEADPDCAHQIECAQGGGVECVNCYGWFCA